MKIGSVVNTLGIPASTLRYYEKIALIKPTARVANSRRYDEDTLLRLRFIQMAQAVGFSIAEIKQLLDAFSADKDLDRTACEAMAETKLEEISVKITALETMKTALESMVDCHCASLQSCVELGEEVKQHLDK